MATLVAGQTVSDAWLAAARALVEENREEAVNLCIEVTSPTEETAAIRSAVEKMPLRGGSNPSAKRRSTETVANTIFPRALYWPARDRQALYRAYGDALPVIHRVRVNCHGTYFERMIDYPAPDGTRINQLERAIERLASAQQKGISTRNVTELVLGLPSCEADIRIFSPARDSYPVGFPCLSHISLTLCGGTLHMTALYRNQYLVARAYGNLVGLGRLLRFISLEAGWETGTIMCVATHMKVDCSLRCLADLVAACTK
jgi:hypothetical protein